METTVGQVIINDMLPEDMRDYNRVWDKKTKGKTLTELARRHPDQFKEVSHNLLRFGAKAAYETGGQSFGIEDIAPTQISRDFQNVMNQQLQDILARAYKRGKTSQDPEVQQEIADAAIPWMKKIDEGIDEELGWENPFYRQAYGTGAQKPGTLRSIVGSDIFYVDQHNKRVPIPVTHGYAQGLTPAEYFIQSFGTRKGMVDLQKATQDAGFLSKQLVQIAHRLVVTDKDDDTAFNPEMPIGYPVKTDDPDNEGSCLAEDIGGYKRNTLLTPKILGDLKNRGFDKILIRSVMVGGPANGGVYALDCGVRETGGIPSKGDFVGINAVQAISEPLTQGAISCLDPETEVRMGNFTIKKLKDIKVGDTVLGASKEGKAFPTKVTNVFHNGIQPVYKITYKQRAYPWKRVTIQATMEHKILQVKDVNNPEPRIAPIGIGAKDPAAIVYKVSGSNEFYAKEEATFLGNIETLDIEVDCGDHLFILANGLIVSNSKHSGGVAGSDSGKAISGFKYVNQLIQVPKHFPGGAVHAEEDGIVSKIEDAPQGGKYIYINGVKHYVGRDDNGDIPIKVKTGDRVEAGDVLTEGIPNPAMVVKYKGIGEGRKYFTNIFREALDNAGTPVHRRNIEMLSRGLINYVKLTDEVGDYAPDDILPYSMIEKEYTPREDARTDTPESLEGQYLEKPVLHYSIGTKLRPSVIKELREFGIKKVVAHKDPPPFEAEMVRGMAHVSKDPDWATRLLGAYNKDSLLEGARRGATSSAESTSYVPAITFGEGDFGHIGPLKQGSVKQAEYYSSPEQFKQTKKPFTQNDRIKLPTNDILTTDTELNFDNDALNDVFRATKDIHLRAPAYDRSGNSVNLRAKSFMEGVLGQNTDGWIWEKLPEKGEWNDPDDLYYTTAHEQTHDFTPLPYQRVYSNQQSNTRYQPVNDDYEFKFNHIYNGTKFYPDPILVDTELPTTSLEWGAKYINIPKGTTAFDVYPRLAPQPLSTNWDDEPTEPSFYSPAIMSQDMYNIRKGAPSYTGIIDETPYGQYIPNFGPIGAPRGISSEEWASYTIPGHYDERTGTLTVDDSMPLTQEDLYRQQSDIFSSYPNYYSLSKKYILPLNKDEADSAMQRALSDPRVQEAIVPAITEFANSDQMKTLYSLMQLKTEFLTKYYYKNTVKNKETQEYLLRDIAGLKEKIDKAWDDFYKSDSIKHALARVDTDLLGDAMGLKKTSDPWQQLAWFNAWRDSENLERYPMSADPEENKTIINKIKQIRYKHAIDNDYEALQRANFLLRHIRRGLNLVNGEYTPFAHLQGASQRIDPATKREWTYLHGQLMQRINQYRRNPRYLNVMRNWELSPDGEGLLGVNKPTLTIEQMKQILQELDQEDKNYQLENSQQFQGYGFNPTA